jgi:hypothetical protein
VAAQKGQRAQGFMQHGLPNARLQSVDRSNKNDDRGDPGEAFSKADNDDNNSRRVSTRLQSSSGSTSVGGARGETVMHGRGAAAAI